MNNEYLPYSFGIIGFFTGYLLGEYFGRRETSFLKKLENTGKKINEDIPDQQEKRRKILSGLMKKLKKDG